MSQNVSFNVIKSNQSSSNVTNVVKHSGISDILCFWFAKLYRGKRFQLTQKKWRTKWAIHKWHKMGPKKWRRRKESAQWWKHCSTTVWCAWRSSRKIFSRQLRTNLKKMSFELSHVGGKVPRLETRFAPCPSAKESWEAIVGRWW